MILTSTKKHITRCHSWKTIKVLADEMGMTLLQEYMKNNLTGRLAPKVAYSANSAHKCNLYDIISYIQRSIITSLI